MDPHRTFQLYATECPGLAHRRRASTGRAQRLGWADSGRQRAHGRRILKLDHLTVVAPTLAEGIAYVRSCLDLDASFGQRHTYMGTCNHLLQLGDMTYLEIVALDPGADHPRRPRWFGLDDQKQVRQDWDAGHRLRGWVAKTDNIDDILKDHGAVFGRKVALPMVDPRLTLRSLTTAPSP